MTEESNSQEDEAVSIDHVPPQRLLRRVCELPLQLSFFFGGQFDRLLLFQPTETHHCPLAQTWWFFRFCGARDESDDDVVVWVYLQCACCWSSAHYPLCPWIWNLLGYSPKYPVQGPPSPLYNSSSSKLADITENESTQEKEFFMTWSTAVSSSLIYPYVHACLGLETSGRRYPG